MGIAAYCSVRMADGGTRRAEDVAPGDSLADPLTGNAARVRKAWSGPGVGMRHVAAGEMDLDLTGDQKLLTAGGWMPAEAVRAGDRLRLVAAGSEVVCTQAGELAGDFMVYDIVLEAGGMEVNGFVVGV